MKKLDSNTVPCNEKRLAILLAVFMLFGALGGFILGRYLFPPVSAAADDTPDYSALYTSEVVCEHGVYRYVPGQPYTYGSDYYRDNTKTHKTEHGGKPSYFCKACIDYYLDMAGYVIARDGDIVYYTGVDLKDLQAIQGNNRNYTVMRDPRLYTYGGDIQDPPLVTAQDGGGSISDGLRTFGEMYSAYLVPAQRQEILCSALDNMILTNETCFLGVYTYRATNWSSQSMDQFEILAFYGDSTGSYVLSEEGQISGHTAFRLKTSSGSHPVRVYCLNANGWFYVTSTSLNATGVLLGTVQTGYSFGLQYCYPLVANSAPTSAVALMTGDLTLPAQRQTVGFQYPRFTSVTSATRTSGSLIGVDSAITTKVSWLAIRHVYNVSKRTGTGTESGGIYSESEYQEYGAQQKAAGIEIGIERVTQNPHNYSLRSEAEFTEYGTEQRRAGRTEGINLVKANPAEYGINVGSSETVVLEPVNIDLVPMVDEVIKSPFHLFLQWISPIDNVFGFSIGATVAMLVLICLIIAAWHFIKKLWN